jgi:hypothetical protein
LLKQCAGVFVTKITDKEERIKYTENHPWVRLAYAGPEKWNGFMRSLLHGRNWKSFVSKLPDNYPDYFKKSIEDTPILDTKEFGEWKKILNWEGPSRQKTIEFADCYFQKKMDFSGFVFPYEVFFPGTTFEAEVDFYGAIFQRKVVFSSTLTTKKVDDFEQDMILEIIRPPAKFQSSAVFRFCIFNDYVNFSEVVFRQTVFFDSAYIQNWADFSKATFMASTAK